MRPSEIITAREALGLTQEEVAARARVSEQSVSRIERGVRVRPNTLKDVCAVLNLPYDGLDTTVLVMPDRLKDSPDTATLLTAAATLPNVRYLVRPDPVGWADHIWSIIRANPMRGTCRRTYAIVIVLGLVAALTCYGATITSLYMSYGTPNSDLGFIVAVLLGLQGCIGAIAVIYLVRAEYKRLWDCHDLRRGYAISEDSIWVLKIERESVVIERITIADATARRVDPDGPFMKIIIRHGSDETVITMIPQYSGLADLIAQPRPMDRFRSVPLEPGMPQVA